MAWSAACHWPEDLSGHAHREPYVNANARVGFQVVANASSDGRGAGGRAVPREARRAALTGRASPAIHQRELGLRLRELRHQSGLTAEQVGERLGCSAAKISRMETGARRASLSDVQGLCRIYGVADPAELIGLAREALEPGWWSEYDTLSLHPYIGLEQDAVAITSYTMYYAPPLLQTADYAEAVIRAIGRRMEDRVLAQRVAARMRRQELLKRPNSPRYRALLDEAVLHRLVGGSAVMRAQLDVFASFLADRRGSLQVIPFAAGGHASADSNFDMLEFGEDNRQQPVVYVETLTGALYLKRSAEISRYAETIEYLREAALSVHDSLALITRIRDRYSD
jgi:transcriptional regulator with XRE-family HTH domain